MSVVIDGQLLSVTDLFKKYNLDEISDILVQIKKEVFVRTNEVKRAIGSKPELMIGFGENVLDIHRASMDLSTSTCELLNSIEKFSSSLEDRMSKLLQKELPEAIRMDDIDSKLIREEQHERLYFGILSSFSEKNFLRCFELYLEFQELELKEDEYSSPGTAIKQNLFRDTGFVRQTFACNCYSFIQGCEELSSAELAQLIILRFILEVEKSGLPRELEGSKFKEVLETSLGLRVDETVRSLKHEVSEDGIESGDFDEAATETKGSLGDREQGLLQGSSQEVKGVQEKQCRAIILAGATLVELFELKNWIVSEFMEFERRGWLRTRPGEEISDFLGVIDNNASLEELKSVLIREFGSIGENQPQKSCQDSPETSEGSEPHSRIDFRFKLLSSTYLGLQKRVREYGKREEILKNSLLPVLVSVVREDLLSYATNEERIRLLDLTIRVREDDTTPGQTLKSTVEDGDAARWLMTKNEHLEVLLNEIGEVQALFDQLGVPDRESVIRGLSEECFCLILNKFIDFCKALFWAIKGRGSGEIPKITARQLGSFHEQIHDFSNIIIQGKQLDILESKLREYLSTRKDEARISFQTLSLESVRDSDQINWRILLKIIGEILLSLEEALSGEDSKFKGCLLNSLGKFTRSFVGKETIERYLRTLENLNSILYSVMIQDQVESQDIFIYQSLLQNLNDRLAEGEGLEERDFLSLAFLYRKYEFSEAGSVTPHFLLLNFSISLATFGKSLASDIQRRTFDSICRAYFKAYLETLINDSLNYLADFYLGIGNFENTENSDKNKRGRESLKKLILSIYCDLSWCMGFSVIKERQNSGHEPENSLLHSPESPMLGKINKILEVEARNEIRSEISELLREMFREYNFDGQSQLPSVESLFANPVHRFPTLPLVRPSSLGSISTKVAMANDRNLKANLDYNDISKNCSRDRYLLSHYSDLLKGLDGTNSIRFLNKAPNTTDPSEKFQNTQVLNHCDEKSNIWLSTSNQSVDSSHSNGDNQTTSSTSGGTIGINKIDTQSIWQVSNLLKETVKDKVFGQG
ncbi:hypothetical protein HWI79_2455 [Cryptosporidium felis]|nr:hypothetical protein HWI79_2455 [Cryptosporidium felis]